MSARVNKMSVGAARMFCSMALNGIVFHILPGIRVVQLPYLWQRHFSSELAVWQGSALFLN